jgi:DNA-binding MarR family transcriptional regulator
MVNDVGGAGSADAGSAAAVAVDAVAARLRLTVGRLVRQLRRYGPANIGPGALSALATLHGCGPMRLGDLAAREGVAPPTLSRIVVALEEAGYVHREGDPADRRAVRVAVTQAGAAVVHGVGEARAGELAVRVRALSPESLAALVAALPVLEALAGEEPHSCGGRSMITGPDGVERFALTGVEC